MNSLFYTLAGLVLLAPVALAQTAPAPPTAPPAAAEQQPAPEIHVDGFRTAKWGMTEAQVKDAIRKDFNIAADKIKAEENLSERTGVLTVSVPELLDVGGAA